MLKRFQLSKALLTPQSIIHIDSKGEPYKMGLTIAEAIGCTKIDHSSIYVINITKDYSSICVIFVKQLVR